MSEERSIIIPNHHGMECVSIGEPGDYVAVYENEHGEQFVLQANASHARLYVADVGWQAFPIVERRPQGCVLNDLEIAWLEACLDTVVAKFGGQW